MTADVSREVESARALTDDQILDDLGAMAQPGIKAFLEPVSAHHYFNQCAPLGEVREGTSLE